MRLNHKQITLCTGGTYLIEPIDPAEILTGVAWDSREVKNGDLYVALPGERTDGHKFVWDAIHAGARGVLVTDAPDKAACVLARELGAAIIEVPNTFHAIEDLARQWRQHISAKVVAVTGSVGKTTTKNLVRDVCSARFRTVATEGNQNNELGVPATILAASPDTQVVVVEMGMRGLGQIRSLCEIARPDWGIVTNVGESHMELLGSKENIARAKSELFQMLPEGTGLAIVNAADEFTDKLLNDTKVYTREIKVALFGEADPCDTVQGVCEKTVGTSRDSSSSDCANANYEPKADMRVWFQDAALDAEGRPEFTLCAKGFVDDKPTAPTLFDLEPDVQKAHCHLNICGLHNTANACAAAVVGLALGIPIDLVARSLSDSLSETGRLQTVRARDGFTIINDTYNANPDSMRAALGMLAAMEIAGRRIAVLGDMGELGDIEVSCHEGIGRKAAEVGIDQLVCVGDLSRHMADAAISSGMDRSCVVKAGTIGEALEALEGYLDEDDVVLVKASHFMHLDRIVEGLVN